MRGCERLIEIGDDVGDMLDADRQPDHFRHHARVLLFFRRHLAMRGRGGMAGERFRVADIDEALDQLQRVVTGAARVEAALDAERQKRGRLAVQIFARHRIMRAVFEPGVVYPGDPRIPAQEFRNLSRIFHMPLDSQRDGLNPLQQ